MTFRFSRKLYATKFLYSRGGMGVKGAEVSQTGVDGPGFVFPTLTLPSANGKEVRGLVVRHPPNGTLDVKPDGSFLYTGPSDYLDVRIIVNGVPSTVDIGHGPGVERITLTTGFIQANFTQSTISGDNPLTVNYTNTTPSGFTSTNWNFGDGTTSTAANPTKTYTIPGTYTTTLTITSPVNTSTKTSTVTVNAVAPTTATLSGATSVAVNGTHVSTVTLNAPALQAYTVTWTRSNSGSGPATSTINIGGTAVSANTVWSSSGSNTVDFTISPTLSKVNNPLAVTVSDTRNLTATSINNSVSVGANFNGPVISAPAGNTASVNWTLTASPSAGITISPSSGTLTAGSSVTPVVNATNAGTYTFTVGNSNGGTVNGVPGSSGGGSATATSSVLNLSVSSGASTGTSGVGFSGPTITAGSGNTGSVGWSIGSTPAGVTWTPSSGTLTAGSSVTPTGNGTPGTYAVSVTNTSGGSVTGNAGSVVVASLAPSIATLTGNSTAVANLSHTSTVTLNRSADQTYTITWSRTGGGTGAVTSTISAGSTSASVTTTWPSAVSGSVDFTISPNLTRANNPLVVAVSATAVEWSEPDWLTRRSGAKVIAYHGFDYEAEVSNHLVGSSDVRDHPVPVRRVVDDAGYGCLEQVVIGAELTVAYTAGDATMTINDDYLWPDTTATGSFYFMVAKPSPTNPSDPYNPDKNLFLCTSRNGKVLTVTYQPPLGSAFAATAQSYPIGSYAGNENSREWRRTFSALPSGENGRTTDDPAAGGLVPLRSKLATGTHGVPRDASYWQYGWYGHPDNQATWANWTPWIGSTTYTPRGPQNGAAAKYRLWDGDTIYIQFRMKISRRFSLYHQSPTTQDSLWVRKAFAFQSEVSSLNQLVVDVGPCNIWKIPDKPQFPFSLGSYKDARVVGSTDWARPQGSYQKGSPWDVAPYFADLNASGKPSTGAPTPDGCAAWKIPDEEWVTFHVKIKPGHSQVSDTEIKVEFARQDQPGYSGSYTTVLNVTDANITFSGSGDIDFPDGLFNSTQVARMDALPGWQSFGLMGYLNLFQAAGWVPPKASYSIRLAQVIYSQDPIPAPAAQPVPSWLSGATARTWISAPQTVNFNSLDVTSNTSIVPSNADWKVSGFANIFAWCGHTWDDYNRRFTAAYMGGHNDYGGNDVLKAIIKEDTNWQRVRLPSGSLPGPALISQDGNQADGTGRYSDGTLRASHTYHNHRFVPGYGHIIGRHTGLYPSAIGSDTKRIFTVDPDTGLVLERANYTALATSGSGEGSIDYDSKRNCLWMVGANTSKWFKVTGLGNKNWTVNDMSTSGSPNIPADNYLPPSGVIRYVDTADRVATFPSYTGLGTGRLGVFNPNNNTFVTPTVTGSFSAGFVLPDVSGGQQAGCGFEWCQSLGCFLLWNNTTNLTEVSTLTPTVPSDWSQPWIRGVLSVAGTNAVTPTASPASGVFGRAVYSRSLNAFLLHSTPTAPIQVFKL